MSWFFRGAQSAIFYYVSCAPCANYNFERRRAKQKARADKETKELMKYASRRSNGHIVIPDEFEGATHERITGVGPFTTNIYWREDMLMGPQPKRGRNRGNTIENLGPGNELPMNRQQSRDGGPKGNRNRKRSGTAASQGSIPASSLDSARPSMSRDMNTDDETPLQNIANKHSYARDRYQRPDEVLWGNPTVEKDWQYYARGRNPNLNLLCPPVVSTKPANSSQARWMLQPPPPAKVMEGRQAPATSPLGPALAVSSLENRRFGGLLGDRSIKRPETAHICQLGDRMTDLFESRGAKRSKFGLDGEFGARDPDGRLDDEHRIQDDHQMKTGQGRSWTSWDSSMSANHPREIQAFHLEDQLDSPDSWGGSSLRLNDQWLSSYQTQQPALKALRMRTSPRDGRQLDGYHSEPEPLRLAGVSSQDFAPARTVMYKTTDTPEESIESLEPRYLPSRDQPLSDSTSSRSESIPSSASSLQPLEEIAITENTDTSDSRYMSRNYILDAISADFELLQSSSFREKDLTAWQKS